MWPYRLGDASSKQKTTNIITPSIQCPVCDQYVKPMNFREEVRAHRDLDGFLAQASILLDERAANLDEVLRRMLTHVSEEGYGSCDVGEVMTSLFTDAGGKGCNGEQGLSEAKHFGRMGLLRTCEHEIFFGCSLKC